MEPRVRRWGPALAVGGPRIRGTSCAVWGCRRRFWGRLRGSGTSSAPRRRRWGPAFADGGLVSPLGARGSAGMRTFPARGREVVVGTWRFAYFCRPWAGCGGGRLGFCVRFPPTGGMWRRASGVLRTFAPRPWAGCGGGRLGFCVRLPPVGATCARYQLSPRRVSPHGVRVNSRLDAAHAGCRAPQGLGELFRHRVNTCHSRSPPGLARAEPAQGGSSWMAAGADLESPPGSTRVHPALREPSQPAVGDARSGGHVSLCFLGGLLALNRR